MTRFAIFVAVSFLSGAWTLLPAAGLDGAALSTAERRVWLLDVGPDDAEVLATMLRLGPRDHYHPAKRFGWTQSPTGSFVREELARSREAAIRDGVSGEQLELKIDVMPGVWQIILWLDIRDRSSRPPRFTVNDQSTPVVWPNSEPQTEPPTADSKLYSITFASTKVEGGELLLKLSAPEGDVVRLLQVVLLAEPAADQIGERRLAKQIGAAGKYHSGIDLQTLADNLRSIVQKAPNDASAVYWQTRLAMLHHAEQLYALKGWQAARDETGLGMFDRLHLAGLLLDGLLGEQLDAADPLVERAAYLRGRLFYWLVRQRGGQRELQRSSRDLRFLLQRYPNDPMLAMYLGGRIETIDPCDAVRPMPNAPGWSNAQREALCRLRQIAHWWVEQRQSDTGEFGGKWGDDVELLRWWAPLAVLGDDVVLRGWRKLADGVWKSRYVSDGYAAKVADVEHAAELVADSASLLAVCTDDPTYYAERLRPSLDLFRALWTDITPKGNRHFRSAWFSSTVVETDPPKDRDVEYNSRAAQPIRYFAWRTGNRRAIESLSQWSHAWRRAALRTDKQKPKGIMPASIRFRDESFNGDGPNWYDADMAWPYYQWEHHRGTLMLDQLLFTYTQTGEDALLEPLRRSLQLVASLDDSKQAAARSQKATPGSAAWAAVRLRESQRFWSVVEQWRLAGDDDRWDTLIIQYGTPYGRYRLTGDERHLLEGLTELLEVVRYNTPLLTTEALHTDRVEVPRSELLKAMLTGDQAPGNISPYYAVTWEKADREFTALVREARTDRVSVQIFSHASDERTVVMRLWGLAPGRYLLNLQSAPPAGDVEAGAATRPVHLTARGQRLLLRLPPQQLLTVSIEPLDTP